MACFTLIKFNRYAAFLSSTETFDSIDTSVSLDLFLKCLAESQEVDEEELGDFLISCMDNGSLVHNRITDMIGMDEKEASYLFYMS